jgi:hypothetical protein
MTHIFAASSLVVTGNPQNHPSQEELALQDTKSISELLYESQENQEPGQDDSKQSNRKTLS